MVYTKNTRKAMNIAYNAHQGQFDKSGVPYIFHPIHVAEKMQTEKECIVALLHDVVEDSDITFEELATQFSGDIIRALKLLTHDDSVPYMDYIENIKFDPIAKKVKLADLEHNSDLSRLESYTENDLERWGKYCEAIEFLQAK